MLSQKYPISISPVISYEGTFVVPLFEIGEIVSQIIDKILTTLSNPLVAFIRFAFFANKVYNKNMRVRTILVSPTTLLFVLLGGWLFLMVAISYTQVPIAGAEDK